MAGEFVATLQFVANKAPGIINVNRSASPVNVDIAGSKYLQGLASFTTAPSALPLGDVTSPGGMVWLRNVGAVDIRFRNGSGGTNVILLKVGDPPAMFRISDDCVLYGVSASASCDVEFVVFDV